MNLVNRLFFNCKNRRAFVISRIIFSVVISILFIWAIYQTCGIWFETNDDVFISELLAGKLTGVSEYHCTFLNILVAYPISLLYGLNSSVPWWGLFLLTLLFSDIFLITFSIFYKANSIRSFIFSLPITLSVLFVSIYFICQIQFTSAAMLSAICGYVVLLFFLDNKIMFGIYILLEFIACVTRSSAMMIIQPMGLGLIGAKLVVEFWGQKDRWKRIILSFLKCVIPIGLILGITQSVQYASLHTEDTELYKLSDDVLVYLVDYSTKIPYSELESVFTEYGFSEEDYENYFEYRYLYPDNRLTKEFYEELIPVLKAYRKNEFSFIRLKESIAQLLFSSSQFWHFHQCTLLLFIIALFICLWIKAGNWIFPLAMVFCGYSMGIVVLAYRDRFVLRVMLPYYFGAYLFVSVIIFLALIQNHERIFHNKLQVIISIIAISTILGSSFSVGKQFFSYGRRQNQVVNKQYFDTMKEISSYCENNPNRHFLIDIGYSRFISTAVFESKYYQKSNFIYTGSWYSKTPSVERFGEEYLREKDFYYLVYETQEWIGLEGVDYYASSYNTLPELVEKFKLTNGATIWVYHIKGR